MGSVYHAANRLEEAVTCYLRTVEINPDHAAAHSNLGLALFDLGDLAGAIQHDRRAVELQPEAPAAHSNLGRALFGSADDSIGAQAF